MVDVPDRDFWDLLETQNFHRHGHYHNNTRASCYFLVLIRSIKMTIVWVNEFVPVYVQLGLEVINTLTYRSIGMIVIYLCKVGV